MSTQVLSQISVETRHLAGLKKIVVGHDFSEEADQALVDAMALADQFNSEIVIAHIESREANDFEIRRSHSYGDRTVAEMDNRIEARRISRLPLQESHSIR